MLQALETIKKKVGRRIRDLRLRAGIKSADGLAERMEVSATSIYELERGENWVSPEMLQKLSAFFHVGPEVFFSEKAGIIEPTPEEALAVLAKAIRLNLPSMIHQELVSEVSSMSKNDAAAEVRRLRKLRSTPSERPRSPEEDSSRTDAVRELLSLASSLDDPESMLTQLLSWARSYIRTASAKKRGGGTNTDSSSESAPSSNAAGKFRKPRR